MVTKFNTAKLIAFRFVSQNICKTEPVSPRAHWRYYLATSQYGNLLNAHALPVTILSVILPVGAGL